MSLEQALRILFILLVAFLALRRFHQLKLVRWLLIGGWHSTKPSKYPADQTEDKPGKPDPPLPVLKIQVARSLVSALVTLSVFVACLYIILSQNYDSDTQKWAFGTLGTILGYVLKH